MRLHLPRVGTITTLGLFIYALTFTFACCEHIISIFLTHATQHTFRYVAQTMPHNYRERAKIHLADTNLLMTTTPRHWLHSHQTLPSPHLSKQQEQRRSARAQNRVYPKMDNNTCVTSFVCACLCLLRIANEHTEKTWNRTKCTTILPIFIRV